jgi:lipoprotein NlpI
MRPLACLALLSTFGPASADDVNDKLLAAQQALKAGDPAAAAAAAREAVRLDPKQPRAHFLLGRALGEQRKPAEAIRAFDAALAADATFLIAVDARGGEQFKLGKIDESIADFDTYLKANRADAPAHWRRGISLYYAGRYADGAKQFFDGQDAFGADVENVFWHYLCNARKDGVESARKGLLKLRGPDGRVPMMRIADLIAGKATAAEVIEAAEKAKPDGPARNEALFYAHLYVGLNYEATGDAAKCREHLTTAVEKHKIGHYMWDVGNVHLMLMRMKKR